MAENEQIFSYDRLDGIRKELDAKIEQKVSEKVFFWTVGVLASVVVVVIGGIFTYAVVQFGKITDKIDDMSRRITVIETKIEERKK